MWDFIKRHRMAFIIGIILFVAFSIYSLNLKNKTHANAFERGVLTVSAPVMGVVSNINNKISSIWTDYILLVGVREENKKLKEIIKQKDAQLVESQEAVITNEQLKKLLDLKSSINAPSVSASVIGEESAPWYKTVVINRGAVDGLVEGMPVISTNGVVGQLLKVALNSSRVLLLTDRSSGIAGMIQRSRARGVLKGKEGGLCSMEFTMQGDDVQVGDIVTTSGIGRIFPKGIPIGEVTVVRKGEYGIFQTITIKPVVDVAHLEEVLVLLNKFE
jgi:rod shape-determining protein MreC